jgi:hypothetical protein
MSESYSSLIEGELEARTHAQPSAEGEHEAVGICLCLGSFGGEETLGTESV